MSREDALGLARVLVTVAAVALVATGPLPTLGAGPALAAPPAPPSPGIPPGFEVVTRAPVAPGVERLELVREEPPLVVHVARIASDAPVSLRAVLSNGEVAGQDPIVERTSSMCRRVKCLLAVNGDFAGPDDQPLGGLLTGGGLLRSPSTTHHQLSVGHDGSLSAGELRWSGTLVPTDLEPLPLAGVNVAALADGLTLYTPAYGGSVDGPAVSSVLAFRHVEPSGPLSVGQTTMVEITALSDRPAGSAPTPVPADGGLIAGRGPAAAALRELWNRVRTGQVSSRALLRLDADPAVAESIGGSPILIRDGARWFADAPNAFIRGRQPRTLVGWNPAGERLLVTVDGRQPDASVGMSLAEAADLLLALGATEGINLDGGGSTTFVAAGAVLNTPSDVAVREDEGETVQHLATPGQEVIGHVERPVTSALAVVLESEVAVSPAPAPGGSPSDLGRALIVARPSTDPGSVPGGGVPALVPGAEPDLDGTLRLVAVGSNALVATALALIIRRRRRRSQTPLPTDHAAVAA